MQSFQKRARGSGEVLEGRVFGGGESLDLSVDSHMLDPQNRCSSALQLQQPSKWLKTWSPWKLGMPCFIFLRAFLPGGDMSVLLCVNEAFGGS